MSDLPGLEGFELPDVEMLGSEPVGLREATSPRQEEVGKVQDDFGNYISADTQIGSVSAKEWYGMDADQRRALKAKDFENSLGILKPLGQFINSISSPGFSEGFVSGPINAVSNLGNAFGDVVLRKEVDVSDAWQIKQEALAAINPERETIIGRSEAVLPQDEGGRVWGEMVAGEIAGVATGTAILGKLGKIPALVRLGNKARQSKVAADLAVKAATDKKVRGLVNFGRWGSEALFDTALSTVFQDPRGNFFNLGDFAGLKIPGRYNDEEDNYLDAFGKALVVDGVALPLSLIGAGAVVPFTRRLATEGDLPQFMQDIADVELAPYAPLNTPLLPPASSAVPVQEGPMALPATGQTSFDYGQLEAGAGYVGPQYDSAISRATASQVQVQHVEAQRTRLESMGLQVRASSGQHELTFPGNVDPEIGLQIRERQMMRGQLIAAGAENPDVAPALAAIDQEIVNLMQGGREGQLPPSQIELSYPAAVDSRPEISTFLAELDELDDVQLREILPKVSDSDRLAAQTAKLEAAQVELAEGTAQLTAINERLALPDGSKKKLTPTGAKRLVTKAEQRIATATQDVARLSAEPELPVLVGDQLDLAMDYQTALEFSETPSLPPFQDVEWDEAAGMYRLPLADGTSGYKTVEAYKEALQQFPRDTLRKMTAPQQSPDVAAIVKARTGRRVWSTKKDDIISALVEYAERRKRFVAPVGQQYELQLQGMLDINKLRKTVDADGNEVVELATPFPGGRGLDAAQREDFKRRILQAAIDNGEVQPDVTAIPTAIPTPEFNQGELIAKLMADETGQIPMMFAMDQIPVYKAGGRSAEQLLEEVRLRYDWAELDAAGQKASRDSFLADNKWNELTWDEKKRMGLGDGFMYSLTPGERTYVGQPLAPAVDGIGKADPDAPIAPPREAQVYRWKPGGVVPEKVAKTAETSRAKKATKSKAMSTEQKAEARKAKQNAQAARKLREAKEQQLADLRKKQEVHCNG